MMHGPINIRFYIYSLKMDPGVIFRKNTEKDLLYINPLRDTLSLICGNDLEIQFLNKARRLRVSGAKETI